MSQERIIKKLIAFDLDDTLAVTKSPVEPDMLKLLVQLSEDYLICVITGGRYEQLKANLADLLPQDGVVLSRFHLMAVSGSQYYRYNVKAANWQFTQIAEDIAPADSQRIADVMEAAAKELGFWITNPAGKLIDQRGAQVAYSVLGQQAKPEAKYAWDPTRQKRQQLHEKITQALPEYEVQVNGTNTIDVTQQGMDKGYGMTQLLDILSLQKEDVLFMGDQLHERGNDYPVKALGIETIEVNNWQQTAAIIKETLL